MTDKLFQSIRIISIIQGSIPINSNYPRIVPIWIMQTNSNQLKLSANQFELSTNKFQLFRIIHERFQFKLFELSMNCSNQFKFFQLSTNQLE